MRIFMLRIELLMKSFCCEPTWSEEIEPPMYLQVLFWKPATGTGQDAKDRHMERHSIMGTDDNIKKKKRDGSSTQHEAAKLVFSSQETEMDGKEIISMAYIQRFV